MTATNKPPVVCRSEWPAANDTLRTWEKAHTREGDAIAAARRRLPMTEVGSSTRPAGHRRGLSGRRLRAVQHLLRHRGHRRVLPGASRPQGHRRYAAGAHPSRCHS
ncbi:DUF899 family protein [Streptomyces sp. NPDC058086]|uniref:DUF899 family protein n=1 Tax=Streptomyces sp. NPDC058086 TaxID=3346334 RepID=UPI0036E61EC9